MEGTWDASRYKTLAGDYRDLRVACISGRFSFVCSDIYLSEPYVISTLRARYSRAFLRRMMSYGLRNASSLLRLFFEARAARPNHAAAGSIRLTEILRLNAG